MPPIEHGKEKRIVVVELENIVIGFIVDKVNEVIRISKDITEPLPAMVSGIEAEYITAIGKLEDRLLILLDLSRIIKTNSIEEAIAELNLDPDNPQYKSDVIKAIRMMKVKKVVSGNFIFRAENLLINSYIFDVRMRLHDPKNQARNIFKTEDKIFESIPEIVKGIIGGLIKK